MIHTLNAAHFSFSHTNRDTTRMALREENTASDANHRSQYFSYSHRTPTIHFIVLHIPPTLVIDTHYNSFNWLHSNEYNTPQAPQATK